MTHLRTGVAAVLGLALPAGLVFALYASDWRHALTGLIAGLTGLIVGTAPAPKRQAPWPAREDLPEEGRT
ncbi:hypothetical protein J4H86_21215 [Spiractinospora alimapuensis]|uniref:hypothetical protein n=1 Tax=Spiractinospora alimapuensis TaxID=2820884 RepID=UPI001F246F61|nr:hypothetical protein [Spiractinospora alimapuensis]QVQ51311.1 hypothetical protein J4H86_21215 [Spiractinospora alimapuensis]